MEAKTYQKYSKKSIQSLIKLAEKHFNKFIRERDKNKPCVSCGDYKELQAGHFYSAGHYSALRFDENNVHGQCIRCNMYLSGNLNEYRKKIVKRIGINALADLDFKVDYYKKHNYKWDRFSLIEIIEKYKR